MSKPDLTAQRLREVLNYDPETGVFTRKARTSSCVQVGRETGCLDEHGYLRVSVDDRRYWAHRLAWLYVHGVWPDGQVDHRNRVRNDNRFVNLRLASKAENAQNAKVRENNTSGHKGVSWSNRQQRWYAYITHQQRMQNLGLYTDINDAVAARKAAEARLHPFAVK